MIGRRLLTWAEPHCPSLPPGWEVAGSFGQIPAVECVILTEDRASQGSARHSPGADLGLGSPQTHSQGSCFHLV